MESEGLSSMCVRTECQDSMNVVTSLRPVDVVGPRIRVLGWALRSQPGRSRGARGGAAPAECGDGIRGCGLLGEPWPRPGGRSRRSLVTPGPGASGAPPRPATSKPVDSESPRMDGRRRTAPFRRSIVGRSSGCGVVALEAPGGSQENREFPGTAGADDQGDGHGQCSPRRPHRPMEGEPPRTHPHYRRTVTPLFGPLSGPRGPRCRARARVRP